MWIHRGWNNDLDLGDRLWMVSFDTDDYPILEVHVKMIYKAKDKLEIDQTRKCAGKEYILECDMFRDFDHSACVINS